MTKAMMRINKMKGLTYLVYLALGLILMVMDVFGKKPNEGL